MPASGVGARVGTGESLGGTVGELGVGVGVESALDDGISTSVGAGRSRWGVGAAGAHGAGAGESESESVGTGAAFDGRRRCGRERRAGGRDNLIPVLVYKAVQHFAK